MNKIERETRNNILNAISDESIEGLEKVQKVRALEKESKKELMKAIKHGLISAAFLIAGTLLTITAATVGTNGNGFMIPAAVCDIIAGIIWGGNCGQDIIAKKKIDKNVEKAVEEAYRLNLSRI